MELWGYKLLIDVCTDVGNYLCSFYYTDGVTVILFYYTRLLRNTFLAKTCYHQNIFVIELRIKRLNHALVLNTRKLAVLFHLQRQIIIR